MPKLWTATIDTHRREVRDAIVDTTASLVAKHGIAAVTMARIAEATGIGRATLYKYFRDVEAILVAWHERHVAHHLGSLAEARDRETDPARRLQAVLETYALITYERLRAHPADRGSRHHDARPHAGHHAVGAYPHHVGSGEISALVHRSDRVEKIEQHLVDLIKGVIVQAARAGAVRRDVAPAELARFCLSALAAARDVRSPAAVRRLVAVTQSGIRATSARTRGART